MANHRDIAWGIFTLLTLTIVVGGLMMIDRSIDQRYKNPIVIETIRNEAVINMNEIAPVVNNRVILANGDTISLDELKSIMALTIQKINSNPEVISKIRKTQPVREVEVNDMNIRRGDFYERNKINENDHNFEILVELYRRYGDSMVVRDALRAVELNMNKGDFVKESIEGLDGWVKKYK